jgi:hypothetical protein
MLSFFRPCLARLSIVVLLFPASGCHVDSEEVSAVYKSYKFDQKVIEKLPIYDSLATAVLEHFLFFQQHFNENESYRAYRYLPFSDQADVFRKLPQEVAPGIDPYFIKLGKDFIDGFDVFNDSTIKIYIRRSPSIEGGVDIEENLSYYPLRSNIRQRGFPVKDTILDEHWQYWTRFNKRGLVPR